MYVDVRRTDRQEGRKDDERTTHEQALQFNDNGDSTSANQRGYAVLFENEGTSAAQRGIRMVPKRLPHAIRKDRFLCAE